MKKKPLSVGSERNFIAQTKPMGRRLQMISIPECIWQQQSQKIMNLGGSFHVDGGQQQLVKKLADCNTSREAMCHHEERQKRAISLENTVYQFFEVGRCFLSGLIKVLLPLMLYFYAVLGGHFSNVFVQCCIYRRMKNTCNVR